jgi:molybdopterin/thiamine biosynthesis adenylyltransferase
MTLSDAEKARFARAIQLPGLGADGVEALRSARVHVVGAGVTAGPAIVFLAQAGVGTLFLDDGGDVSNADAGAWLYTQRDVGQQRLFAAMEVVRAASSLVEVRPFASDTIVSATLVCSDDETVARRAAEQARRAGVPHVVGLANGEGGEVVDVPSGAPCFRCAHTPAARVFPRRGAAAGIGTLAALELVLLLARVVPGGGVGRRIDLLGGMPTARPTERIPGCDCYNVY